MKDCKTPILLTPPEAAKALSISPRKLWGLTFEGEDGPPYVRLGRLVRYPADRLQEWIQGQTK